MKIRTKHKILTYILCLSMILGSLLPFTTNVYGESNIKDSIGSINQQDDGVNIGLDETQYKKTTYSESIESDGPQDTLVYVSQASTFGVFIPKTIVLSGQDKNANYLVRVSGNIGGTETIKVVPDKTFNLSQYGKKDIVANVLQDKTFWFFNEIDVNGNGEIIANDMSAGSWNGKFNFNISLGGAITVEAKDSNGNDLAASASEIINEEKNTLLDSLVSTGMIKSKNDVSALINVKSNDFDSFANTTFNVSSIAQEGDKIAILHFDETKQEWEYISTETVDSEGKISANFTSFSPVAFVKINDNGNFENMEIAGLYDANGKLLCTWANSGINVEQNYSSSQSTTNYYKTTSSSPYYVITNRYPTTTKVILPEGITYIGSNAFYDNDRLKSVIIPNSVTLIKEYAFFHCDNLTSVKMSNKIVKFERAVFSMCSNLPIITLPNTITYIGEFAFSCTKLKTINYTGTQAQWNSIEKEWYWKDQCPATIVYNYKE